MKPQSGTCSGKHTQHAVIARRGNSWQSIVVWRIFMRQDLREVVPVDKEQIKKENEKKKEYLWSYKRIREKAERAGLDVNEYRLSKICPSVVQDGMPKAAGDNKDLSDYAAKLDELENTYMDLKNEELDIRMDIRKKIEKLSDPNEVKVLDLRYLQLYEDWEDIYKKMGLSKSRVHKIHSNALIHLKI